MKSDVVVSGTNISIHSMDNNYCGYQPNRLKERDSPLLIEWALDQTIARAQHFVIFHSIPSLNVKLIRNWHDN